MITARIKRPSIINAVIHTDKKIKAKVSTIKLVSIEEQPDAFTNSELEEMLK